MGAKLLNFKNTIYIYNNLCNHEWMKKIYIILYCFALMFSFHSYGENNSYNDFKVAGISLFDDLYDHLSQTSKEKKVKVFEDYYEDLKDPYKFTTLGVENHPTINKKYENVEISFKNEEGRLIIHSISSGDFYTDIDNCLQDKSKLLLYKKLK